MNRTVYFADKAVLFTAETPGGAWYAVSADAGDGLSRDKILNFLESHNSVAVVAADPDAAFAAFAALLAKLATVFPRRSALGLGIEIGFVARAAHLRDALIGLRAASW